MMSSAVVSTQPHGVVRDGGSASVMVIYDVCVGSMQWAGPDDLIFEDFLFDIDGRMIFYGGAQPSCGLCPRDCAPFDCRPRAGRPLGRVCSRGLSRA